MTHEERDVFKAEMLMDGLMHAIPDEEVHYHIVQDDLRRFRAAIFSDGISEERVSFISRFDAAARLAEAVGDKLERNETLEEAV